MIIIKNKVFQKDQKILKDTKGMSEPKKTGYELSFADFQRLLSDTDYSPSIVPLLRRWFGYEIDAEGKSIRILSANEVEIDMFSLYQQIQADSSKQYDLYQAAMTLWR